MDSSTASWSWHNLPTESEPDNVTQEQRHRHAFPAEDDADAEPSNQSQNSPQQGEFPQDTASSNANAPPPRRRHYRERTCRICLDTVQPQFVDPTTGALGGLMGEGSKPVYISPDDPSLGRLISPCKCKGSQRYVHEGCLHAWRKANPGRGANPNFFICPTCHYHYRVGRLTWARQLQSSFAQVALTALVFALAIFLLGFVAEPIFSLWNDPVGTIADTVAGVVEDIDARREPIPRPGSDGSWTNHFFNGFTSLGIIGFAKYLIGMTPWEWWNMRSSGIMGGGGRRGGRNRAENINWMLIVIGALSFVYSVWKAVRFLSNQVLKMAGDTVLDVGGDDDDED